MRHRALSWVGPTILVGCIACAGAACSRRLSPNEFAEYAGELSSRHGDPISHYVCSEGERGYDYVCVVTFESAKQNIQPQRHGIRVDKYGVKVGWTEITMPTEGPVLSPDEIEAYNKKTTAAVEARNKRVKRGAQR